MSNNVLPSDQPIDGFTQSELAERWGVQALSTNQEINPFFSSDSLNTRGRRGTIENHDNFNSNSPDGVYFLGGTFIEENPVVRTIIAQEDITYFAPFANQFADNTTDNVEAFGGYALTTEHADDLEDSNISFRPVDFGETGVWATLLDLVEDIATDDPDDPNNQIPGIDSQFVIIDGSDLTPEIITNYIQQTNDNLNYEQLSRHTGAAFPRTFLSDPDLGEPDPNKENPEFPQDYIFPTLSEINPSGNDFVVPFVQSGYYLGFELDPGDHTVQFGGVNNFFDSEQNITYEVLNPIEGTNGKNNLNGTEGNDYIDGKNGKDNLSGLGGDDLIVGGNGKDCIDGGFGDDELWGDEGEDKFIYRSGYGEDTIFDFSEEEVVELRGFEEFDDDDFEDLIRDITLPSGVNAAEINFGNGNVLKIVGVLAANLEIDDGEINFDD